MNRFRLAALAALACSAAVAAPASAQVTYSFAGSNGSFSFTQPDFLKTSTRITSFTASAGGFSSIDFCFDGQFGGCGFQSPGYSYLGFNFGGGGAAYTAFNGNPFTADGVTSASAQSGSAGLLTISGTTAPVVITPPVAGAVPEPASWIMLIFGMGSVGYTLRRRRTSAPVSYAA